MYTHEGAGLISETFTNGRSGFMSCPEKACTSILFLT